jgi:alcohol dehydrogenase (NADP+)
VQSEVLRVTRWKLDFDTSMARARENFNISALPEDALDEINRIQTRQRFNAVVKTGSPGFIPR